MACNSSLIGVLAFDTNKNSPSFCNGASYTDIYSAPYGSTQYAPGLDCMDIIKNNPYSLSGIFWIQPVNTAPAFQTYCDMSSATGGFTGGWYACYTYIHMILY